MIAEIRRRFHMLGLAVLSLVILHTALGAKPEAGAKGVKNVILLIADGASAAHLTLTRWYKGGAPLAMDAWVCGLVRTYGSNTPLTDSAPAATAFASGFKSFTGFVGLLPQQASMWGIDRKLETDSEERPLVTVLEAARLAGKSTGIVASCEIPHATPAAFSAHQDRRKDFEAIAEQQVYNGIDVVLAGGAMYLEAENRKDGEDLKAVLRSRGYQMVGSREEMLAAAPGRLWGLFAREDMSFDLDRGPMEPSLAEMTAKASPSCSAIKMVFFSWSRAARSTGRRTTMNRSA